jgi:hypothetical protein
VAAYDRILSTRVAYLSLSLWRPGREASITQGTFQDLEAEKIVPVPGMRLDFYCDDGNDKGERDYLLFAGVIDRFPETGDWYAMIDGDRFWHESDV